MGDVRRVGIGDEVEIGSGGMRADERMSKGFVPKREVD